jgi:pimeloyl-ACP methyl ester carboxylesterase
VHPLARLSIAAVALLAAALVVAFLLQRRLLYFPQRTTETDALARAERAGLVPWRDGEGALRGWRLPRAAGPPARVLVLHGNAGSALDRAYYVEALAPHGLDVVLLEYPGYGARPGTPSLETLAAAAVGAVDALAADGAPVWLVGESLGSGVAARAAALRPDRVAGLLLVTPFADLAAVARLHYPAVPAALLRDRFRPAADLASFRKPAVVLVAGRDEVVSAEQGRQLHAALPGPKLLVEQPSASHNSLDLGPASPFWREAILFLRASR